MAETATEKALAALQEEMAGVRGDVNSRFEQIQKARRPAHGWGNAGRAVAEFDGGPSKGAVTKALGQDVPPQTYGRTGEFFRDVVHLGMNYNNPSLWPDSMRKHIETNDNWTKSYATRLKVAPSGLNETVLSDGGVLVPPQFTNQLLMRAYDNDLLSRTTMFPMTGTTLNLPTVAETSRADGQRFGGILAYWEGEAQAPPETKPQLAQIQLNLNKLFLLVRSTQELQDDAGIALETFINNMAAQELEFRIGDSIINGDGVRKMLGIMNSPSLITVAKDAGQAANTVTTSNITNMWSRMWIGSRKNAVWFINQDVEPQLLQLSLGIGTAGVATYLPPGGLSGNPYATLLGRPVIATEFNSTLGTAGDIMLADLSMYVTGSRGGMQSAVSMHVYFSTMENLFRFSLRLDGRSWWLKALTPFRGTQTKSPFIVLGTRS